ncbi:MAG: hypothetical protein AAAB20_20370 [Rhizobium sp.]|jgi:hypothetical protein|uniref:hypothetical protein n=1 Tax=Rhizobium sp. TaxID=391 RepID=UPI0030F0B10A
MSESAISNFLQGKTLYIAVATGGLLASWWVGGGGIEAHRPVPQIAAIEMADADAGRPGKDDMLASLPPKSSSDIKSHPVSVAEPISLPIPEIVRRPLSQDDTKGRADARAPIPAKRPQTTATFESCLPACDTRDPLVAPAHPAPAPRTQVVFPGSDIDPPDHRTTTETVVDGGQNFIWNAARASRGALEAGRSAMSVIVNPWK